VEIEAKVSENTGVGAAWKTAPDHIDGIGGADNMTTPTGNRTTSPAFQFYASEFLTGDKVTRMSFTEIGIFTCMLAHAWLCDGLPTNLSDIAKILKINPQRFTKIWAGVLSECWIERGGRYVNPRQERERTKQQEFRRRQSDNGSKGGRPKGLGFSGLTHSKARALESEDPLRSSSVQKRDSDFRSVWGASAVRDLPPANYDQYFAVFRDAYHANRRVDNPIVRNAFMGVFTKSDAPPEQIFADLMSAVRNHAGGDLWARGMAPAMVKWLDEGHYLQRHDPPGAAPAPKKPWAPLRARA
jgi:uncharacterized protein YdaU (DUF1376 family)